MSRFNVTLSALLFAAAVSASAATIPSQAEAGRKWNGTGVQGILLNGTKLNGTGVQGIILNGMRVQGVKLRRAGEPSQPAGMFDANAVTIKMITFPEAK